MKTNGSHPTTMQPNGVRSSYSLQDHLAVGRMIRECDEMGGPEAHTVEKTNGI